MAAADRELTLKSSSGDHVKLLLHGQSARSVSTAEEGTEMFFGPVKVVSNWIYAFNNAAAVG